MPTTKNFQPGDCIFKEGEAGGYAYLLEEGLVKPHFESRPGWPGAGQSGEGDQLPQSLLNYVKEIESLTRTPIRIVSMGPDRAQTHEFEVSMA